MKRKPVVKAILVGLQAAHATFVVQGDDPVNVFFFDVGMLKTFYVQIIIGMNKIVQIVLANAIKNFLFVKNRLVANAGLVTYQFFNA